MADIDNLVAQLTLDLSKAEAQLNALARKPRNFQFNSNGLGRITKDVSEFEKSLGAANARVVAFGASALVLGTIGNTIRRLVVDFVEVEKALTDINTVANLSNRDLKALGDNLFNTAKNTRQSFSVAAEAAKEFSRQGLSVIEIQKRTQAALVLTGQSGLDATDSVKTLTVALNTFNKEGLDAAKIVNTLANVDANFAVSSKDLADAISRVGSAASDAGVSFNELNAITATVVQTTGRSGAVIGNALKSIFTRTQRGNTLDELENIGVAVRDLSGKTLPAIQILQNLANVQDNLSDSQKSFISELVGGVFQVNQLKAALGDLAKTNGIYSQALKVANNTTDEAFQRNSQLNQTLSAQANALQVNIQKLASSRGQDIFGPILKSLVGKGNEIAESLNGEGIGSEIGKAIASGIGNALSGPGAVIGGLLLAKLTLQFGKFALDAAKNVLVIGDSFGRVGEIQKNISSLAERNSTIYLAINNSALTRAEREASYY